MPSFSLAARIRQSLAWRLQSIRDRFVLARARVHRRRLNDTVFVGITGSAGKTTTKDLAVAVLSRRGATSGNAASLNYLIDVALVIIAAKRSDRFTVVEIGASKPGSMDAKIALTRPSLSVLTVVQRDHIKNFESVEAIAAEKGKLIHALPADGTAVLNIDDPLVRRIGEQAHTRRIWFGTSATADIRLVQATSSYPDPLTLLIEYNGRQYTCKTSLHGTHLTVPVLAAIGLGLAVDIPIEECIRALATVRTTAGRMQIVSTNDGVTFLHDDYKAPYWSFQAALDHLRASRATRKVAVIGTLSDYSLSASKLYPKVPRQAMEAADLVVFVGPHALRALKARTSNNDRTVVGFTEIEEAHRFLRDELRQGDLVLLKGSNRADHLVRLMLARSQPVTCWASDCGWNRFCDVCPKLDMPVVASAGRATSPGETGSDASRLSLPIAGVDSFLIVGMGNRGDEFVGTPHNVGFTAVDRLARQLDLKWSADSDGELCRGNIGGQEVILFKSSTLINLSGPGIERVRLRHMLNVDRVIVVHDDADLKLGDARIKHGGSDGGHKGLRSVFSALKNDGVMKRVRIGVRAPSEAGEAAKSFVVQRFPSEYAAAVQTGLDKGGALLEAFVTQSRP